MRANRTRPRTVWARGETCAHTDTSQSARSRTLRGVADGGPGNWAAVCALELATGCQLHEVGGKAQLDCIGPPLHRTARERDSDVVHRLRSLAEQAVVEAEATNLLHRLGQLLARRIRDGIRWLPVHGGCGELLLVLCLRRAALLRHGGDGLRGLGSIGAHHGQRLVPRTGQRLYQLWTVLDRVRSNGQHVQDLTRDPCGVEHVPGIRYLGKHVEDDWIPR